MFLTKLSANYHDIHNCNFMTLPLDVYRNSSLVDGRCAIVTQISEVTNDVIFSIENR